MLQPKNLFLSLAGLLLLAGPTFANVNLIANPDFAIATYNPAQDISYAGFVRYYGPPYVADNQDITNWNITGQSTSGAPYNSVDLLYGSPYGVLGYDGATTWLDLEGATSGVISQTFATTPGDTYTLAFAYANNPGGPNAATMNVTVTGTSTLLNDTVSHSGGSFSNLNWDLYSNNFTADSSTATLQFMATTDSGYGIALDGISGTLDTPTPTPEPGFYGILGLGLAGFAFLANKRRFV